MGIAALILGIASLVEAVFGFIPFLSWFSYLGLPMGIVAIILGAIARKKGKQRGQATGGLVTGIISVALNAIAVIIVLACYGAVAGALASLY